MPSGATIAVSAACTAVALTASLSPFAALSGIPIASTITGTEFTAIGDALGIARVLVQTAFHVEQVLGDVPADQRCQCSTASRLSSAAG